jgi:hypothetical protein
VDVATDEVLDDLWSLPITSLWTDESTEMTDADLVPPPDPSEAEPVEVAELELATPEPEPATLASDLDHKASIPPWPERSLDVLPYADRSRWPGVRGAEAEPVPVLPNGSPPEPATNPDDADLEAYTLPAPRAAD